MKLTKQDYITLRLLMFDLLLTDLSKEKMELVFRIQTEITKKLKELGFCGDEIITCHTKFSAVSPSLHHKKFINENKYSRHVKTIF